MSIQLVTYANQTVTPTNDAIIYEKAVDQNGIFYGCNVTVTSNTVNITGGYGLVCGREFVINSESIAVTLAPSGTLDGRLYVRLDLADADAPIQLLTATGNTLPPLVQDDDVNYTNGVWEMELATFTVGVSALSDVVETFEEIKGIQELMPPSGSEYFTLDAYSGFDNASAYGIYDKSCNTVRLYMFGIDSANIPMSTTLFTVPEGYRPTGNIPAIAVMATDSTNGIVYYVIVGTDGTVKQNLTAYLRRVIAICEYQL